jgi:hypothetical protein
MTKNRLYSWLGAWLLVIVISEAQASLPYLEGNRQHYIVSVLTAFNETNLITINNTYRYLDVARRNNCRSSASDLRADCLLSYARKNCESAGNALDIKYCELYSDVIVVNKLNEGVFIGRSERYGIMKGKRGNYRDVLANRILQKYARIVTHFSIAGGAECSSWDYNCMSQKLDRFCLDYANTQSLSWHHCVGATLWIIGTARPTK